MELPSYFDDFLSRIEPSDHQKQVMAREHKKLRELLDQDKALKPILLSTFIQGSQRRRTAKRGSKEHPCDVDVVAVTNLPRSSYTAAYAHGVFEPFLKRHYKGQFEAQARSWLIKVDEEVTMDLVPTSEPDSKELREAVLAKALTDWAGDLKQLSEGGGQGGLQSISKALLAEAEHDKNWDRSEPLWIPDRTLKVWEKTHPLHLISWTAKKNLACNGNFTRIVKIMRWWKCHQAPLPKYPKGYPLEHIVAECCPDGVKKVAEGLAATFAEISRRYAREAAAGSTPFLPARGVHDPEIDVMRRVREAHGHFRAFHTAATEAARLSKAALDSTTIAESAALWRQLLGEQFPTPPQETKAPGSAAATAGFTAPPAPARPRESRFA
jgi:hypothetical protein